ncbi:MAG TPA: SAM-dependent methyltransferase, partial [Candidatus Limnocylindrales bacterium]
MSPAAKSSRQRLDQLLVERGLVPTRSRAQALVMAGKVRVGEGDAARTDRKAGDLLDVATRVEVVEPDPYVSRGGHKLAAALDAFRIDPRGRTCLDVGASTGGFTDVLLQRGARRVYAIDVGRGQLAERLRLDERVVSRERTNA